VRRLSWFNMATKPLFVSGDGMPQNKSGWGPMLLGPQPDEPMNAGIREDPTRHNSGSISIIASLSRASSDWAGDVRCSSSENAHDAINWIPLKIGLAGAEISQVDELFLEWLEVLLPLKVTTECARDDIGDLQRHKRRGTAIRHSSANQFKMVCDDHARYTI
jgi:hypothetical protein